MCHTLLRERFLKEKSLFVFEGTVAIISIQDRKRAEEINGHWTADVNSNISDWFKLAYKLVQMFCKNLYIYCDNKMLELLHLHINFQ